MREYERQTGISLSTHPLAVQFEHCNSLKSVLHVLVRDLAASGSDSIITEPVKRILFGLHKCLTKSSPTGSVRRGRKAQVGVLRY
jgi:hypothetical protein